MAASEKLTQIRIARKNAWLAQNKTCESHINPCLSKSSQQEMKDVQGIMTSQVFRDACQKAGIETTRRQALKWQKGKGVAYKLAHNVTDPKNTDVVAGQTLHCSKWNGSTRVHKFVQTVNKVTPSGIIRCSEMDLIVQDDKFVPHLVADREFTLKVRVVPMT